MEFELPEGWTETTLGEIASWGAGGTPSRKEPHYYGGEVPWIKTGDLGPRTVTEASELITKEGLKNSSAKLFPSGSVAIAMYGATIGKTSILGISAATNQACAVGNPTEGITFTEFLYYFLLNEKDRFIGKGKGGAQPNISQALIKSHEIPLPPLAEQKVIADKLDTLLAQVETTKARLERIPEILKTFRQSVLAAAVSGKLTEEWRKQDSAVASIPVSGSEKYKQDLFDAARQSLPQLPDEWLIVPAAKVLQYVTSGSRGWASYYSSQGALFLRMTNVRYDTINLDLDDIQFVNLPEKVEGKRSLVKKNDLVISITADVGRVACIDEDLGEAYINQHLALARPIEDINSEYLATCIASLNVGMTQVNALKRGATKAGLGLNDIRSLAIPFPTLAEQTQIVHRVEELFAFADSIEQQNKAALERVNKLTQSILAKAFRGELTADWRTANPELISGENSAEALLAKIQAEREAMKPKKKAKKKTKAS